MNTTTEQTTLQKLFGVLDRASKKPLFVKTESALHFITALDKYAHRNLDDYVDGNLMMMAMTLTAECGEVDPFTEMVADFTLFIHKRRNGLVRLRVINK